MSYSENMFPVGNNFSGPFRPPEPTFSPTPIDLNPYGIDVIIDPSKTSIDSFLTSGRVSPVIRDGTVIKVNGVDYITKDLSINSGHSKVYMCSENKMPYNYNKYIMKAISISDEQEVCNFLKEAIIQIILMKYSEGIVNGPFVPIVYGVGIDRVDHALNGYKKITAYIVSQRISGRTFEDTIRGNTEKENDIYIKNILTEIHSKLHFFKERLQFTHGDLKADNIMYDNKNLVKFIDFGNSYLRFGNLHIKSTNKRGFFDNYIELYKNDMYMLVDTIISYNKKYLSDNLRGELEQLRKTLTPVKKRGGARRRSKRKTAKRSRTYSK